MKKFKTGKIDFQAVLAASASGMAYTVITNAISNSGTIGPKWNKEKDVNYALGATALGAGLIYFLPKAKWATPAGYGLLGAGGAVAAQVITSKIKPTAVNGFLSNAFKKAYSYTPIGAGQDVVKKLLNREHACNCASPKQLNGKRRYKLNGVIPDGSDLYNFDVMGLN
jgi:hypothetical protein